MTSMTTAARAKRRASAPAALGVQGAEDEEDVEGGGEGVLPRRKPEQLRKTIAPQLTESSGDRPSGSGAEPDRSVEGGQDVMSVFELEGGAGRVRPSVRDTLKVAWGQTLELFAGIHEVVSEQDHEASGEGDAAAAGAGWKRRGVCRPGPGCAGAALACVMLALHNFLLCRTLHCAAPAPVPHSLPESQCFQADHTHDGYTCELKCEDGFKASVSHVSCNHGKLRPAKITCIDTRPPLRPPILRGYTHVAPKIHLGDPINFVADLDPTTTEPVTYSVRPDLPNGLSISRETGVISGIPQVLTGEGTYSIRVSNRMGVDVLDLTFAVVDRPPEILGYTISPAVYRRTVPILVNAPVLSGGNPTGFTVSPELPPGLTLDELTGVVSGTPKWKTAGRAYTITASNLGGISTFDLQIEVMQLSPYTKSPAVYAVGKEIEPNVPLFVNGHAARFEVQPRLPNGLSMDETTGIISGTPMEYKPRKGYEIKAFSLDGHLVTSTTLRITVRPKAFKIRYSSPEASYVVGERIVENVPQVKRGLAVDFAIEPELPEGLELDAKTGVISGVPVEESDETEYKVTATGESGTAECKLRILVTAPDGGNVEGPTFGSYSTPVAVYRVGLTIRPNRPSLTGGWPTSFSLGSYKELPRGLRLARNTGIIEGTPESQEPQAVYTIVAKNSGGEDSYDLSITVLPAPPILGGYSEAPAVYVVGVEIQQNRPEVLGGDAPIDFKVSPELPPDLKLDPLTGVITGIPRAPTKEENEYMITAANSGGSDSVYLPIRIENGVQRDTV